MLQLNNLIKNFRLPNGESLPVLNIPQFSLNAGEQCALIGRSGCGKTTLLNVIAGITKPDDGEVLVDSVNLARLPEAGRDRLRADKMGFVYQTFNLLPAFTALENVLLAMTFATGQSDSQRATNLLSEMGLSHRLHHKPGRLSVGEQQRVAVARALANSPKLVLADEPTANVDPKNQQQIVDLIRNTCESQNISLLLVTHASGVAEQFSRCESLEEFNQAVGVS